MKNSETKCHIEVEGVILTKEAIQTLLDFQNSDNWVLKDNIDQIKDVICWIVSILDDLLGENEIKKAIDMMGILNSLKEIFVTLEKP